ncbi:MAG: hypothetical protein IJ213_02795 [Bacteroidales bacterium]|nr:hypothetical protein [Bacteroidales bacterium]
MNRDNIILALSLLREDIEKNISSLEYEAMYRKVEQQNAWFIKQHVQYSLKAILPCLKEDYLREFCSKYSFVASEKTIAVIAAGNIPGVCLHDVFEVLLSGNKLLLKLSSVDNILVPFLLERLNKYHLTIANEELPIRYTDKISSFDAVIATGSNSTSLYFETYFAKYPHIIRKSRSSIAVIDKEDNISGLEDDIMMYMGLGCRNISHLFLPKGFDFNVLQTLLKKYDYLINHSKYRNNYDYYKAVFLMNSIGFKDFKSLLLVENFELHSPVSVVYYTYYDDVTEVNNYLIEHKEEIQCIVADKFPLQQGFTKIPFGKAQLPLLDDFADGVDTMRFLEF